MENNQVSIYSKTEIDQKTLNQINDLLNQKFKISFNVQELQKTCIIDKKILGGILLKFNEYTIILPNQDNESTLTITSSRLLTQEEKERYQEYAKKYYRIQDEITAEYIIKQELVGGIKIKYKDKEIDLTIDSILDKIFS